MEDQAVVFEFLDWQIFCVSHQLKRVDLGGYSRDINNTRVSGLSSPSHNASPDQHGGGSEPIDFAHRVLLSDRFSATEPQVARARYVRSVSLRCRVRAILYRLYRAAYQIAAVHESSIDPEGTCHGLVDAPRYQV
jgi:hypothetical protein